MKRIALYLIIISALSVSAENNSSFHRDYSIVPPAPTVAQLQECIQYNGEDCCGQPNINIPIYTLVQGSLSLPISISYESGGVKVDQEPSTAGLSWRLNCSAAISRTVLGKPDEFTSRNTTGLMYASSDIISFRDWLVEKLENGIFNPIDTAYLRREYAQAALKAKDYTEGRADLANDIFRISGCGLNATVIFDYKNRVPTPYIYSSYSKHSHSKRSTRVERRIPMR